MSICHFAYIDQNSVVMRRILVSGTVGLGGAVLFSSVAEISNINNVYLVCGTLQAYITAVYLVLRGREIYYLILRKSVD
jgi:hypothetical protein